jgi:chemosensory pili system protein ChpA (sensor histidine kinase/response regulator)
MSSLSDQFLAGFAAEARGRVEAARRIIGQQSSTIAPASLADLDDKMQALAGTAFMLELHEIAAAATAVIQQIQVQTQSAGELSEEDRHEILAAVDAIEIQLDAITPGTSAVTPVPAASVKHSRPDLPSGLLEIFAQEAYEHLDVIQASLEHLRHHLGDAEALRDIRRASHTLKGASASVGMDDMAAIAHLVEDLLEEHLDNGAALSDAALGWLFDATDLLEAAAGPGVTEGDSLISMLEQRHQVLMVNVQPGSPREDNTPAPEESSESQMPFSSPDSSLRLPLAAVDGFINRVGEVVINRSALERHAGGLRGLVSELDYSTRRLRRAARNIDTEIEVTSQRGSEAAARHDPNFDPLEMDRYSRLYQLTRELEEAAADADDVNEGLMLLTQDLDAALARERRLTTELQDELMRTRMVSFREIENRLRQTVRRTTQDLSKPADLTLIGFDSVVDKTILNRLADPLMHLLRNAIDHGIEQADIRQAADKPLAGSITISARRERGRMIVTVADDGAGVNFDRVRQRAVQLGMIAEQEAISEDRLTALLFEEDFSIAEIVTQTSGRGIGLNIVRRAVRELQGTIRLESVSGKGTTFILSVPISLAMTTALYFECAGAQFAVSAEQVSAVLRLPADLLEEAIEHDALRYEGRVYSLFDLADFVGNASPASEQRYGLVIDSGDQATVVLVDKLAGIRETVMKSLGGHLRRVHGLVGATISGDGRIVLILDLSEIMGGETVSKLSAAAPSQTKWSPSDERRILVVDDSLSVRHVVTTFLQRKGWNTITAKDGIEALERLAETRLDVALVDIEMPRMNGYELLARIRSNPELHSLPVIFLTSRSSAKHRDRAVELGATGYLVKPYRDEELLAELDRVVEKVR